MISYFPINHLTECFIFDQRTIKTGRKKEIDLALKKIENLQKRLKNNGLNFYLLIIPDKSTQYHDYFEENLYQTQY